MNAGESSSGGFVVSCRHSHCVDRDRLDFLAEMVRAEWFEKSVLTDPDYNLELEETAAGKDGRPILVVNQFDHSGMIVTVRDALMAANAETPRLFRYAANLARLVPDTDGRECIGTLGMEEMREEIRRNVHCRRHSTTVAREVEPPNELVRPMLVGGAVAFPVLEGVVRTPVFGPNGTINTTPGYDRPSRLFYDPNGLVVPDVSPAPDAGEVERAKALLMTEVLGDFPFDGPEKGESEKAHALAMFLQPFARAMIDGPTPIYLIEKPTPGTGASKLVNVWGLVCHGEEISSATETGTEDEMRKRLTATVLEGKPVFYLDNLNRKLEGSALASAVTTGKWTDRRLGVSETIEAKIRHTWIVTGNNPTMSNEITRRCMRIRLDAKVERPEERKDFRHADLEAWVMANRGELVWACLTLVQNWVAEGKPTGPQIGSFERWSRTMGGILACASVEGFLKNAGELRKGSDEEGDAIRSMLAVWWTEHGSARVKAGGPTGLHNSLADHDALPAEIAGERDTAKRVVALGRYVAKLAERIFTVQPKDGSDEIQVRVSRDTDSGGSGNWKLVQVVRKEAG